MTKEYNINWRTNTITMTKAFAEKANQYNSEAYNLLMDARSKGFHIEVRKSKPRKACPTRVTFKQMENYLSCLSSPDVRLEELHKVMDAGKSQKNMYNYVRKWFLEHYPNFSDTPILDVNHCIVAPRVELMPAEENLKLTA